MHGGVRNAARKGDRVKIVPGEDGDLFSYLSQQRLVLRAIGAAFVTAAPVVAGAASTAAGAPFVALSDNAAISMLGAAVGTMGGAISGLFTAFEVILETFNLARSPPSLAVGYISEGSSLVKIGCAKHDIKNPETELVKKGSLDFLSGLTGFDVETAIGVGCTAAAVTLIELESLGDPASGVVKALEAVATKVAKGIEYATSLPEKIAELASAESKLATAEEKLAEELAKPPANQDQALIQDLEEEIEDRKQAKKAAEDAKADLDAAIESVEEDIAEAKAFVEKILGTSEAKMLIKIGEAAFIANGSAPLIEKVEKIGTIFGAEQFFANINDCYYASILTILSLMPPIFSSLGPKDLDAKIRELAPDLPEEEVKTLSQILGAV
jgi:hypothetical protein